MSTFSGSEIATAFSSSSKALLDMKIAFFIGLGAFLVCLPFCRSKKSFFDAIAARKIMKFLRTVVFCSLCCTSILFYFYITYGSPIQLDAQLSYGNNSYNSSWLYGFPRPTCAAVTIGLGLFGDSHPFIRLACMMGCLMEIVGDCLSAYQVYDYRDQQLNNSAPSYNGYTPGIMLTYYYRDIAAIAVATCVFLFTAHMNTVAGWCDPPLIHPALITGKDYDRYSVMRRTRGERLMMEKMGIIESTGSGPNWNLKIKTSFPEEKREVRDGNKEGNKEDGQKDGQKDDKV